VKKTKRLLLLILPLVLIGLVFVFLRLTIFADIAQGQFTLYRLSEFPNLFNHSASLGYQNIPLGKKEKVAEVSLRIPRGETEGLTLMLDNKTSAAADKLTILKGDFQDGKGNVLSKNLIDERVVHVWPTKQFDSTKPSAKRNFWSEDRDELLVKNDQTDFLSTSITPSVETQLNSNGGTGDNPDPQEPVLTSLSAGTSKKFYLKVTAPADQTGDFSSTVRFFDRGLNRELTKLTIKLTVLDLDLIKPSQGGYTMGCFNNDRIKTSDSAQIVGGEQLISQELFAIRMKKAKDYGCETMVQRIGPYSNNKRALEIFSELGYPGPIILNYYYFEQKSDGTKVINTEDVLSSAASKDEFKKIVTEIKDDKKITVPIIFYGYDEPNEPTQQPLHLEKVRNMDPIIRQVLSQKLGKSNISPSYSTTLLASTIKSFEEKGLKTDLPIVAYQSWPDYLSSIKSGAIYNPSASGFYYQGYMEFPLSNRLLSGFGLVNSGMKGSFANPLYGYSSAHERTRPLYDD